MNCINRAAVVVRPKAPFFDWARTLEGGLPNSVKPWTSVYLFEIPDDDDFDTVVRERFLEVFEEQLESWHLVVDHWPAPRTYAMFEQWFDFEIAEPVRDLDESDIEHEDY